jgi:hypothetical protein
VRVHLAALALLALSVGCSSLKVEVDVASPVAIGEWTIQRMLTEALPGVSSEPPGAMKMRISGLRQAKLQSYLVAHAGEYGHLSQDVRQVAVDELKKSFDNTWGEFYTYHSMLLESIGENIRTENLRFKECQRAASKVEDPKVGKSNSSDKASSTCNRDELVSLLRQRERLFADVSRGPDFVLDEPRGMLTSLVGQDGLFREPEAHAVASAPPGVWSKNFDRSYSWSLFGDTNVAIKMESRGNFSIKGVSFDPSEVTRVASKVVTQSLLAWTQIAGVPATPAARQPGSIPVLMAQNDQERMTFEADRNDQWRALLAMADAVASADKRIVDDDASKRTAIVNSLVAIWDANKERILHKERDVSPSKLTLTPADATVVPGEKIKLYPAVTEQTRDVNVGIACASTTECPFVGLPAFVLVPAGKGSGQIEIRAQPEAAWRTYSILASLDGASRPASISIAPTVNFAAIPQTMLVGTKFSKVIDLTRQPPDGTTVAVTSAGNLRVTATPPLEGKINVEIEASAEGHGDILVKPGATELQKKTITILKPAVTIQPISVVQGDEATVKVLTTLDPSLQPELILIIGAIPTGLTLISPPTNGRLTVTEGEASFNVKGNIVGSHPITVAVGGGDSVTGTVTVTPHVLLALNGGVPIGESVTLRQGANLRLSLSSATLKEPTIVNISATDAEVAEVIDAMSIPANGDAAELEITPHALGETEITIVSPSGTFMPLHFKVEVEGSP